MIADFFREPRKAKISVREATGADMWEIIEMRNRHNGREFVGDVEMPASLVWFVAEANHHIVAAIGTGIAPGRRLIVTDFFSDETWAGKKGLLAIIEDFRSSGCKLFLNVPLDRPALAKALQRRGAVAKSIGLEYPP